MATAPLISSSGAVSISSSGAISFGTSSSKCDCGCKCVGGPCICCKPASCVIITGTGALEGGNFFIECGVDGVYEYSSTTVTADGCCWNYVFPGVPTPPPDAGPGSPSSAIVQICYSNTTGNYSATISVYATGGCILVYTSMTPDINCLTGTLSGTIVFSATITHDGMVVASCSGTATLSTTDDCGACWRQVYSCIGESLLDTFITCETAQSINASVFRYGSGCYYPSVIGVTSLPAGATVLSLSDISPTGNSDCTVCTGPYYVQARRCLGCAESGEGPLVNIWFSADDIPSGAAFTNGEDCFYIRTNDIFVPGGIDNNRGFPDGSFTLGGDLYAGSDFDPSNNCLTCLGASCPFTDLTSWLAGPGGGTAAMGFNPTYTANFTFQGIAWQFTDCSGTSTSYCFPSAYSIPLTADPTTPCQWINYAATFCDGSSGSVILSLVSGKWQLSVTTSGGTYGGTTTLTACLPTGNYGNANSCLPLGISGAQSILTAVTVT